jgi:hypothetical protein
LEHFLLGGSKMNGKLAVAVAFGLTLGFAAALFVTSQPEAQAQAQEKPKKQQWEYKVVYCALSGEKGLLPDKDAAKTLTEQYNTLAADRWEYVGPVVEQTYPVARGVAGAAYQGIAGTFVLFKRSKP